MSPGTMSSGGSAQPDGPPFVRHGIVTASQPEPDYSHEYYRTTADNSAAISWPSNDLLIVTDDEATDCSAGDPSERGQPPGSRERIGGQLSETLT